MKINAIILLFSITTTTVVHAQDTAALPKPTVKPPASYFSATLSYLSNAVYNGRKDSVTTPYITPVIGYYDKSGFFIDGSLSYLARNGSSRVDLFTLDAGYDFNLGNFDGELSASKYFYNNSSTNVSSGITGGVYFSGGYDFLYIKPLIEAGINFGSSSDYTMSFGLEHTFYGLKDKLQVTPGIKGAGSTQNYYGEYYNRRTLRNRKRNNGMEYEVSASVENASAFKLLDYQFSMPVSYTIKKCSFIFSPVYVLPVNPAVVNIQLTPVGVGTTITKTSVEAISPSFYWSFSLNYSF